MNHTLKNLWPLLVPFFMGSLTNCSIIKNKEEAFTLRLTTNKIIYALREEIKMTFTVSNETDHRLWHDQPDGQAYDFVIIQTTREIWRWSHDKEFCQIISSSYWESGYSEAYEESWHQMDNQGEQVKAGKYQIYAEIPDGAKTALLSITISNLK